MDRITFLCSKESLQDFYSAYPKYRDLPQFPLLGRSNVGKSSLINHLFHSKKMAKTAKRPGKTALLQFFLTPWGIFIDLPGYGFAKISKKTRAMWDKSARSVLENNPQIEFALFLLDIRRELSPDDEEMLAWMQNNELAFLTLFTKMDKLTLSQRKERIRFLQNQLQISLFIPYSIHESSGKKQLLYRLRHGIIT